MNAQLRPIESSPAREALRVSQAHRAQLEAQLEAPRAARARVQLILDEAAAAQAAVAAAITARRDLEVQHLLLGKPTDSAALQAAEADLTKAQKLAATAERKADPARAASAQLDDQINRLVNEIRAEANRVPMLCHAALVQEGEARLERFLAESLVQFARARAEAMAPWYAAEALNIRRNLGLPPRLHAMKTSFVLPMPTGTGPTSVDGFPLEARVDMDPVVDDLARQLLADLEA